MEEAGVASAASAGSRYACILCGVQFLRSDENEKLRSHLAADHLNYRPVRCSICGLRFSLHSSYVQHAAAVHDKADSKRDLCNLRPTTNRDRVLEATLESLLRLSTQKNWRGSNPSADSPKATENDAAECSLCSESCESFTSSKSRKHHVRQHTFEIRSKADVSARRIKKKAEKRGSRLRSFWVVYAKCFPFQLRADLLEVPHSHTRRSLSVKPKHLLLPPLQNISTTTSASYPKRQCTTATHENSEHTATKSKRIRSLPKRFAEQSVDLPPSIDATRTTNERSVSDQNQNQNQNQNEMRPATVVLERCDYMLPDYGVSFEQPTPNRTPKSPLPTKNRQIGGNLEVIEDKLGEICSQTVDSSMEGGESGTSIPVTSHDPEPSITRRKRGRPRKSAQNSSFSSSSKKRELDYSENVAQPKERPKGGSDEVVDVVNFTDDDSMSSHSPPALSKGDELSDWRGDSKPSVKGSKGLDEKGQAVCSLCNLSVPRTAMFRHTVVRHLFKDLWKCSVCSFSSQLHASAIEQHIESTHETDENAVPVDLLPDYLHTLRAFFFKCFPGKRFVIPNGKKSGRDERESPSASSANGRVRARANANCSQGDASNMQRCNECRVLVPCDDLKAHVANHLSRGGCYLLRCLADGCSARKPSKTKMIDHFEMVHPRESISYVDESFSPEMQQKLKMQMEKCFVDAILCGVCFEPVASGIFAVDHVWGHMFDDEKTAWRYKCRSCTGSNSFNREVFLKKHLTTVHGALENDDASLSKAKDDLIIDRMDELKDKFTDQWSTCYPSMAVPDRTPFTALPAKTSTIHSNSKQTGNSNNFVYCKLCSVNMPNEQGEKHIYWHIARMFLTCRFKCRVCEMEDSDREQLAEGCMRRHATQSTDGASIDDQSKTPGSTLPSLFRACAGKCFDAPPPSLFDHLTDRSRRQIRKIRSSTNSSRQLRLNKAGSNSLIAPIHNMNGMGKKESQSALGEKCRLCDERVAIGSESAHSERHLVQSGEWKRFRCGRCDFAAKTSDEVERHYENVHYAGFSEFYQRSRPNDDEVSGMRQRCFYADGTVLSEVVDSVCSIVEDGDGQKGDVQRRMGGVEENLTCALCKTVLIGEPSAHVYSLHTGQRRFDCVHCDESFGTKQQLKGHVSLRHVRVDVDLAVKQSTDRLQTRMTALMRKCFGVE